MNILRAYYFLSIKRAFLGGFSLTRELICGLAEGDLLANLLQTANYATSSEAQFCNLQPIADANLTLKRANCKRRYCISPVNKRKALVLRHSRARRKPAFANVTRSEIFAAATDLKPVYNADLRHAVSASKAHLKRQVASWSLEHSAICDSSATHSKHNSLLFELYIRCIAASFALGELYKFIAKLEQS